MTQTSGKNKFQLPDPPTFNGMTLTGVLNMTNNGIVNVDYIDFNLATASLQQEGRLNWSDAEGGLQFGMPQGNVVIQIGLEGTFRASNQTGVTIPNGRLVYISGSQGNTPTIELADNRDPEKIDVVGMTTEEIPNGQRGYVTLWGKINELITPAFPEGTKLYLGINGLFTADHPTGSTEAVLVIGTVTRQHATEGQVLMTDIKSFTLGNNHDVTLRQSVINANTGSASASGFTTVNDAGHFATFGIGGSNNSEFPDNTVFFGQGYNHNLYACAGNKSHIFYNDPLDSHSPILANMTLNMELTAGGILKLPEGRVETDSIINPVGDFTLLASVNNNLIVKLGDNSGATNIQFQTSSGVNLFSIDSNGFHLFEGQMRLLLEMVSQGDAFNLSPSFVPNIGGSAIGGFSVPKGAFTAPTTIYGLKFGTFNTFNSVSGGVVTLIGASLFATGGFAGTQDIDKAISLEILNQNWQGNVTLTANENIGIWIKALVDIKTGTVGTACQLLIENEVLATNNYQVLLNGTGLGSGVWFGGTENTRLFSDANGFNINADVSGINPQDFLINCGTEKTLVLQSPVYTDQQVRLGAVGLGVSFPVRVIYKGAEVLQFANNQSNEINFNLQFAHGVLVDSDTNFHVHTVNHDGTGAGNVRWQLTVCSAGVTGNFGTPVFFYGTQPIGATTDDHEAFSITEIFTELTAISEIALCTLTRLGSDGLDTYEGNINLIALDSHFKIDTVGSRQPFIK